LSYIYRNQLLLFIKFISISLTIPNGSFPGLACLDPRTKGFVVSISTGMGRSPQVPGSSIQ
jgi:hypothetical protein